MINDADQAELGIQSVLSTDAPQYAETDLAATPEMVAFRRMRLMQRMSRYVLIVVLAVSLYCLVTHTVLESIAVAGDSMKPTLGDHARYFLVRMAFCNREPRPSDVVVFIDPADRGLSVKRVIGMPGDMVHIKEGKVYVNWKEIPEPYLAPDTPTFTYTRAREQLIACGQNQYFVLGDNRLVSIDSRAYGAVPRQNILGLVLLRNPWMDHRSSHKGGV
jgi:signal peptidase I